MSCSVSFEDLDVKRVPASTTECRGGESSDCVVSVPTSRCNLTTLVCVCWLVLISFWAGQHAAENDDCVEGDSGMTINPFTYIRRIQAVQASPFSWTSPELLSVLDGAKFEILGGFAATALLATAFMVGGPPAASLVFSVVSTCLSGCVRSALTTAAVAASAHREERTQEALRQRAREKEIRLRA